MLRHAKTCYNNIMKKTAHLIGILLFILAAAVVFNGCKGCQGKKKQPAAAPHARKQPPAPERPEVTLVPPRGKRGTIPDTPGETAPLNQGKPRAQFPADIDKPHPPQYRPESSSAVRDLPPETRGTVSGKVLLGENTPRTGNLFIYIPDAESVNQAQPRALAAQVITADRIKDSVVEFTLKNVPPGEYLIVAIWDIDAPRCDASKSFCAIFEGRDRLGQSDLVEVLPGLKTAGVMINLKSNELM